MDTKSQLILQLLITFMMAFLMSGIMTMLHHGITLTWLRLWPREFITAWPIAFVLSMGVGRVAFFLLYKIRPPHLNGR